MMNSINWDRDCDIFVKMDSIYGNGFGAHSTCPKNFGALSPGETQSTGFQKLILFWSNFMEKYPLKA